MNKSVNLDGLHDVMVSVMGNRSYSAEEVLNCFNGIPEDIKQLAYQWGGNDTVFRDKACEYLKNVTEKHLSSHKGNGMTSHEFFAKYKEIEEKVDKFYGTKITFNCRSHCLESFEIEEDGVSIKYSDFHCWSCKDSSDEHTQFASWEELGVDFNETPSIISSKVHAHV